MSEGAPNQAPKRASKRSVKKPDGEGRQRSTTQAAAFREDKALRTSTVPEIAPAKGAGQRVSVWRVGLISTLTLIVGAFAWLTEGPEFSTLAPSRIAASSGQWPDPLGAKARREIEHDLRVAALALDIREGQENLSRLWDDARGLATRVATLASGLESLKAEETARSEQHLLRTVSAAGSSAIDVSAIVERELGLMRRLERLESQLPAVRTAEAETVEPMRLGFPDEVTGALPDADPKPTVKVKLAGSKAKVSASRPIKGWMLHAVHDDLALVEGNGQHYEVRPGEFLPEAGIVKGIKKRGESWLVVTNKGVIPEPK